jgi:hypothetical protein
MADKHTPGPWDASGGVMRPKEFPAYFPIFAHLKGGGDPTICTVWSSIPEGEFEANSRLIASAPELLKALRDIARTDDSAPEESLFLAKKIARSAIAKVEGQKEDASHA